MESGKNNIYIVASGCHSDYGSFYPSVKNNFLLDILTARSTNSFLQNSTVEK